MNKVEEEIIELIKKNDDRAIDLIYDHYSSMIYGLIFLKCKNRTEADDLLQKVFIKIVKKRNKLTGTKYLKSYICRLALNEVNDFFRQKKKQFDLEQYKLFLDQKQAFNTSELEMNSLKKALIDLPEEQNRVVMMKVFEGFTFKDIGHLLGVSANTAASRYRYALMNLRKSIIRSDEYE